MTPASQRPWWLAFCDRTNVTVIALTASAILYTKSIGVVFFAAGAVICSLSAKAVKRGIRQHRPPVQNGGPRQKKTYGMPSTHSAAITYFATYIPLASLYLPVHSTLSPKLRVFAPLLTLPWATLVVASRVWLGYHSWSQVIAGALYGAIFACGWFSLYSVLRVS